MEVEGDSAVEMRRWKSRFGTEFAEVRAERHSYQTCRLIPDTRRSKRRREWRFGLGHEGGVDARTRMGGNWLSLVFAREFELARVARLLHLSGQQ
jgi:hypothetical protein